jgi:hypothetical protein
VGCLCEDEDAEGTERCGLEEREGGKGGGIEGGGAGIGDGNSDGGGGGGWMKGDGGRNIERDGECLDSTDSVPVVCERRLCAMSGKSASCGL